MVMVAPKTEGHSARMREKYESAKIGRSVRPRESIRSLCRLKMRMEDDDHPRSLLPVPSAPVSTFSSLVYAQRLFAHNATMI